MDSYLEAVALGTVRRLKEHVSGFPAHLADYGPFDEQPEGVKDTGFDKWQAILQEIVDGLEASIELRQENTVPDGVYSDEPMVFEDVPGREGELYQLKEPVNGPRFNDELYKQWEAPLLKKKNRAFYLLRRHWGSFWD
jgi:hypothetical protein